MAESTMEALRITKDNEGRLLYHTIDERNELILKYSKEEEGWVCTHYRTYWAGRLRSWRLEKIPDLTWTWDDSNKEPRIGGEPPTMADLQALDIDFLEICEYARDFMQKHYDFKETKELRERLEKFNADDTYLQVVDAFKDSTRKVARQERMLDKLLPNGLSKQEPITPEELEKEISAERIADFAYRFLDEFDMPAITETAHAIGLDEEHLGVFKISGYNYFPVNKKTIISLYLEKERKRSLLLGFGRD